MSRNDSQHSSQTELDKLLKKARIPEKDLPDSFHESLHIRLAQASLVAANTSHTFWKRIAIPAVIACSLALVFSLGLFLGKASVKQPENTTVEKTVPLPQEKPIVTAEASVKTGEPVTIRIVYNASRAIAKVRFTISLENGVKFATANTALAGTREIVWEGELSEGRNEIPVVVTAEKQGIWLVKASADYEGGSLINRIKIVAEENNHV